ncbi:MAG TPA: transcription antitermination factor NusB [Ignavibacteria bacterium]|nr:transcription antitermination factor NusB [Ignavibacteria bacterium]HRA99838.1 transcription antitermination factor NusB [Ignavibacteria bacterium]
MPQLKRREVRIKVMQVLYAHEISKEPISKIKKDLMPEVVGEDNVTFSDSLIKHVLENEKLLDEYILGKVLNWELERMALVDRIVMRMGISELLFFPDIPPKVSINEAIDISKDFCTRSSGRFVNGVLDAIHDDLKRDNKLVKTGRGLVTTEGKNKKNNKKSDSKREKIDPEKKDYMKKKNAKPHIKNTN